VIHQFDEFQIPFAALCHTNQLLHHVVQAASDAPPTRISSQ